MTDWVGPIEAVLAAGEQDQGDTCSVDYDELYDLVEQAKMIIAESKWCDRCSLSDPAMVEIIERRSNRPLHPCLGGQSPYTGFLPLRGPLQPLRDVPIGAPGAGLNYAEIGRENREKLQRHEGLTVSPAFQRAAFELSRSYKSDFFDQGLIRVDPGACPDCGEWRKFGITHRCDFSPREDT